MICLPASVLYGQDSLCRLSKSNIVSILNFGIDRSLPASRVFEMNCESFSDSLTFYIDKNESHIKEGDVFVLKNKRIAVYRQKQGRHWLLLSPPEPKGQDFRMNFERMCGGATTSGYMTLTCDKGHLEPEDIWFGIKIE